MGALFHDESDTDSINTTSTALSEEQDVYEVEKVLAEERSIDDGVMRYLIKWTGYPLSQSTWEPIDNIQGEEILKEWAQQKQLVREGKVKPFNVDDFDAAVEEDLAIKDEKNRRRKAKKRKRGIPVSSDEKDTDEEDEVSRQSTPPQERPTKRLKTSSPAIRKGVVRKLEKGRAKRQSSASSSEESSDEAKSSGGDSLAEELASRSESSRVKRRSPTKSSASASASIPARPIKRPEPVAKSTSAAQATRPIPRPLEKTKKTPTTARKSVRSNVDTSQSLGTAKRTSSKNVMSNWDADAKQRKRRAAGESGFRNLKHQNNSLKFRAEERAPDIQRLEIIDPKTGRPVASKLATAEAASRPAPQANTITPVDPSGNIQAAYGRRTPPPAARERTVTPLSPDPVPSTAPPNDAVGRRASAAAVPSGAPPVPPAISTSSAIHDAYSRREPAPASQPRPLSPPPESISARPGDGKWQIETCRYWLAGDCVFDERNCRFAHWHIAEKPIDPRHLPNKQKTCYFWKRGGCRKPEEQCSYAHHDTGIDAWAPGHGPTELTAKDKNVPNDPGGSKGQFPAKAVTCYYWKHDTCSKQVGECRFAHYDTGVVAPPPAGHKKGSRQSDGFNANEVPLGVRRTEAFSSVEQHAQAPLHIPAANAVSVAQQPATDPRLRHTRVSTDTQISHPSEALPMECTMSPAHVGNDTMNQGYDHAMSKTSSIRVDSVQRRPSLTTVTVKAMLSLLFAPNNHPISDHVRLEISEPEEVARVAGKEPTLRSESVVMAADVEHLLWEEKIRPLQHASGGIAPYVAGHVDALTELCKIHACGLIARPDGYSSTMLIYPSNAEEWKFIAQDSPSVSTECVLRFRIFQQLSALDFTSLTSLPDLDIDPEKPQHIARIGEDLAMLDRETFLHGEISTIFLMIPPGDELEVYRAFFHDLGCKVYHSGTPGAWEYFKKKKKLAVFLHASVPVWRVPDLHPFLSNSATRFFSIGHDPLTTPAELSSFDRSWTRLFPHGTVLFITDDILVYRPERATEIINTYNNAHKRKPEGGEFSRIATRPGLKAFLTSIELQTSDARYNELYKAVCTLCPADDEEDGSGNPSPDSNLISVNPDLLPSFEGKWEKDPAAATNFMVDWFAGWSASNATRYRKFMICYEASEDGEVSIDPAGWTSKYQHIGVVSTQQAIAQFHKERDKKR